MPEPAAVLTVLAEIHRLPGLSPEAFRRHYEAVHVPLARELLSFEVYRRCYPAGAVVGDAGRLPDCLSEFGYRDQAQYRRVVKALQGPFGERLRADEMSFMDKSRNRHAPVEETVRLARESVDATALALVPLDAEGPTGECLRERLTMIRKRGPWRVTAAYRLAPPETGARLWLKLAGDARLDAASRQLARAGLQPAVVAEITATCGTAPE